MFPSLEERVMTWHNIKSCVVMWGMWFWQPTLNNWCQDFLMFISIHMPVPSKDNVNALSFCPALLLPFRIFPVFHMFFNIWHNWYGIFYVTFSDSFSMAHTYKSFCKWIPLCNRLHLSLLCLLTRERTCVSACPLWLMMYDWAPVPHYSTDRGSSCELVPINKPASLFPVVGDN